MSKLIILLRNIKCLLYPGSPEILVSNPSCALARGLLQPLQWPGVVRDVERAETASVVPQGGASWWKTQMTLRYPDLDTSLKELIPHKTFGASHLHGIFIQLHQTLNPS